MLPVRPHRTRRAASIIALAAAAALLSACSGSSGDGPTSTASTAATPMTSSSATGSSSGGGAGSSTSGATSASTDEATDVSSSALITGTTSVPLSTRPASSTPSTPEPSGSAAVGSFDASTVRYFAALCSGLQDKPRDKYESLTGDFESKRTQTVALFTQQAERLDGAAEGMKAAGAPNIPEGDTLASVTIETYPKVAAAAREGSKLVAAAGTQDELDQEFQAARESTDAAGAPLDDVAEIIGAPAVVGQMKKIAACASVLNG